MLCNQSDVFFRVSRNAIIAALFLVAYLSGGLPARADILFQNQTTGVPVDWYMNNTTLVDYTIMSKPASALWKIVGSRDFNGDGKPDLITTVIDGVHVLLNTSP